jgi:hypothetical protein
VWEPQILQHSICFDGGQLVCNQNVPFSGPLNGAHFLLLHL